MHRELGPMDTDWLNAVLSETNGVQLVAVVGSVPVALIGCVWGADQNGSHYVTDIAVAPDRRGQGLGSRALQLVITWPGHRPTSKWTAFVNPRNTLARAMLRRGLWKETGMSDEMMQFEKLVAPTSGGFP